MTFHSCNDWLRKAATTNMGLASQLKPYMLFSFRSRRFLDDAKLRGTAIERIFPWGWGMLH